MYKKVIFSLFVLLLTAGLSGCFGNIDKEYTTEYFIVKECIDETDGNVTRYVEYPRLFNESGYYAEVNQLIEDTIMKINSSDVTQESSDRQFSYRGSYEVIFQSEELISIKFVSHFYAEDAANAISSCYGMTIDLTNMKICTVAEYVYDADDIIRELNLQNYEVVFGSYSTYDTEELMEAIEELVEMEDNSNFCVDDEWLYVIGNDVTGSDYSVIRIKRVDKDSNKKI